MNLINDIPATSIEEDQLQRANLVDFVFQSLNDSVKYQHPCFCLGIYGKWGEGKSSFMNFVKQKLRKANNPNILISDFNPWLANNHDALMWDFFNMISMDVTADLKKSIHKYSGLVNVGTGLVEKISAVAMGIPSLMTVGGIANVSARRFRKIWNKGEEALSSIGDKTLEERKREISEQLVKSNYHRFVFIDDIDRLDKDEIHSVFRLVREVADFDNVTYIIAMDPDIVAKSLGSFFGEGRVCDGRSFIEKIVQVPIQLPVIQGSCIKRLVMSQLSSLWTTYAGQDDASLEQLSDGLAEIFTTQRQIIRFVNQLKFVMPALKGEVNMSDLCYLEAIKSIDPQAYLRIYQNRGALYKERDSLKAYLNEQEEEIRVDNLYRDTLDMIVKDMDNPIKLKVRNRVDALFSETSVDEDLFKDEKRLCEGVYFSKYFIQTVPEGIIPDAAFEELFHQLEQGKIEKVSSQLNDWYSIFGYFEVVRAVVTIVRKGGNAESKRTMALVFVNALVRSDIVKGYGYTSMDHPNNLSSFIVSKLLSPYLRSETNELDQIAVGDFLCQLNSDPSVPFQFLLHLNLRVDESFSFKDVMFCQPLVDRFKTLSYDELLRYSKVILRPFFLNWLKLDAHGPEFYLKEALKSKEFDALRFLQCHIENVQIEEDIPFFLRIFKTAAKDICQNLEQEGVTTEQSRPFAFLRGNLRLIE